MKPGSVKLQLPVRKSDKKNGIFPSYLDLKILMKLWEDKWNTTNIHNLQISHKLFMAWSFGFTVIISMLYSVHRSFWKQEPLLSLPTAFCCDKANEVQMESWICFIFLKSLSVARSSCYWRWKQELCSFPHFCSTSSGAILESRHTMMLLVTFYIK